MQRERICPCNRFNATSLFLRLGGGNCGRSALLFCFLFFFFFSSPPSQWRGYFCINWMFLGSHHTRNKQLCRCILSWPVIGSANIRCISENSFGFFFFSSVWGSTEIVILLAYLYVIKVHPVMHVGISYIQSARVVALCVIIHTYKFVWSQIIFFFSLSFPCWLFSSCTLFQITSIASQEGCEW